MIKCLEAAIERRVCEVKKRETFLTSLVKNGKTSCGVCGVCVANAGGEVGAMRREQSRLAFRHISCAS